MVPADAVECHVDSKQCMDTWCTGLTFVGPRYKSALGQFGVIVSRQGFASDAVYEAQSPSQRIASLV